MKIIARWTSIVWLCAAGQLLGLIGWAADDLVIADFESADYGEWTVDGIAFGNGPAKGTLPGQMNVAGFLGKGLVNSFVGGDPSTGTLTSPEFKIKRRYLKFLIGGGGWEGKTCINLLVKDKIVRTSAGPNTNSGGSEDLNLAGWDLMDIAGQSAKIQIVDLATGGWGHINVDQIVLTDEKPPIVRSDVAYDIVPERQWLLIPIKNGGPKRKVTFVVDGIAEPALDVELADDEPDWWAPREISVWRGRKVQIIVNKLPDGSRAFEQIQQRDRGFGANDLYREPFRPQIRFSARRGWLNDPNGMVFYDGTYHFFFQHNPYGWSWGNMHWGHATSSDMVHWNEESEVLYPDRFGPMFSGSGVVDWKNSSGFGKDGVPPIVLIYTAAGDPTVQCLAYSTDRGQSFTKYQGNPILGQITSGNRDPKVFYHAATNRWVMSLYVERHDKIDPATKKSPVHTIQFFTSSDLKSWTFASELEGFFECPDLFPLAFDGDANQTKWVLTAASSEYMVGTFDGQTFVPETSKLPGHRGRGFYAAQTFSDLPKSRRVQIGWLQAESPGMPFNQTMSLPLDLELTKTTDGPRLRWKPIDELKTLRTRAYDFSNSTLSENQNNPFDKVRSELMELEVEFKPNPLANLSIVVRGIKIQYASKNQELSINDLRVKSPLQEGRQQMTIFVDRTSLEIFASNGLVYVPFPVIPKPEERSVSVSVEHADVEFSRLVVHELKSIWVPAKH